MKDEEKPKRKSRYVKKIPTPTKKQREILKTKQEHPEVSVREIAKLTDTSHPHVIRTLKRFGLSGRRDVEIFKKNRADIFAGIQSDLTSTYYTLSDSDKQKLVMRRGLLDTAIMYDKERLEEGLSTANVMSVIADVESIRGLVEGRKVMDHNNPDYDNRVPGK